MLVVRMIGLNRTGPATEVFRVCAAGCVWARIPQASVAPIREAKVLNGDSPYYLDFDCTQVDADALGYLVPNHLIRQSLYEEAAPLDNVELLADTAVEAISTDADGARVTLPNGETCTAETLWHRPAPRTNPSAES